MTGHLDSFTNDFILLKGRKDYLTIKQGLDIME